MSFNNTPITAKIKRTSQGGVITQPILNMGAPVKMKASSPAKQTVSDPELIKKRETFRNEMSSRDKAKADDIAAFKVANKAKKKADRNATMDTFRSDVSTLDSNIQEASKSKNPTQMEFAMRRNANQAARITKTENDIYNQDKESMPGSTDGYTPKEYTMSIASGTYESRATKTGTTKPVSTKPAAKKPYVKKGGKATGSMKDYKIGSQARSDEYTARGWKQDSTSTVTKPKVKAVSATPSVGVKEVSIKSKLDSKKETESKAPEQTRKTASIDKKQGKADKARANGNEKKAVRKEKAIKKKKARVAKRSEYQGQSKDAINPS